MIPAIRKKTPPKLKPAKSKQTPQKNAKITAFFEKKDDSERKKDDSERKKDSENVTNENSVVNFYNRCISEAIVKERACTRVTCTIQKSDLSDEISKAKANIHQIQRAQSVADEICKEKDNKIQQLQHEVGKMITVQPKSNEKKDDIRNDLQNAPPFINFAHVFNSEQLKNLRSIDMSETGDSSFILHVMRYLFEHDLSEVEKITIKCQSKNSSKKPMSREKLQIITEIFLERLQKIDETLKNVRNKRLNMLMNRAITSIIKSLKRKCVKPEDQPKLLDDENK